MLQSFRGPNKNGPGSCIDCIFGFVERCQMPTWTWPYGSETRVLNGRIWLDGIRTTVEFYASYYPRPKRKRSSGYSCAPPTVKQRAGYMIIITVLTCLIPLPTNVCTMYIWAAITWLLCKRNISQSVPTTDMGGHAIAPPRLECERRKTTGTDKEKMKKYSAGRPSEYGGPASPARISGWAA